MDRVVRYSMLFTSFFLIFLAPSALGSDPELTTDFGINVTSGASLTFTGFRGIPNPASGEFGLNFAFVSEFPALNGLGVGGALLKFGPNSINAIHSHPRGNEILFLLDGSVDLGIVDTNNSLFTATLQPGDAFVFPKGLLHFQINRSKTTPATALAAFSSENAGRLSFPPAIFNSVPRIADDVLEKSFNDFLDPLIVYNRCVAVHPYMELHLANGKETGAVVRRDQSYFVVMESNCTTYFHVPESRARGNQNKENFRVYKLRFH